MNNGFFVFLRFCTINVRLLTFLAKNRRPVSEMLVWTSVQKFEILNMSQEYVRPKWPRHAILVNLWCKVQTKSSNFLKRRLWCSFGRITHATLQSNPKLRSTFCNCTSALDNSKPGIFNSSVIWTHCYTIPLPRLGS